MIAQNAHAGRGHASSGAALSARLRSLPPADLMRLWTALVGEPPPIADHDAMAQALTFTLPADSLRASEARTDLPPPPLPLAPG